VKSVKYWISPHQAYGYKNFMGNYPKVVTPECFYRGSTLLTTTLSHVEWVGGPVIASSGFPIQAFGNDGLETL
jgi:hypothetical protein